VRSFPKSDSFVFATVLQLEEVFHSIPNMLSIQKQRLARAWVVLLGLSMAWGNPIRGRLCHNKRKSANLKKDPSLQSVCHGQFGRGVQQRCEFGVTDWRG
jgi:hypothetical protein